MDTESNFLPNTYVYTYSLVLNNLPQRKCFDYWAMTNTETHTRGISDVGVLVLKWNISITLSKTEGALLKKGQKGCHR